MEMMARLHVKHFAVCNDNGRVQSVITDSMVASLADQWATDAEQAFNTLTVEQMMQNSLPKCMITVDKHTKTGKAFQQMIDNSIDKVGVTWMGALLTSSTCAMSGGLKETTYCVPGH